MYCRNTYIFNNIPWLPSYNFLILKGSQSVQYFNKLINFGSNRLISIDHRFVTP